MGEYVYASIQIGGRVSRNQARKLVELGNHYGLSVDGQGGDLSDGDIGEQWTDDQINYGNLDDLTAYCTEHGIDYEYYYSSGPGWDAQREKFFDSVSVQFTESEEGAVVPIADLVKLEALATGWAAFHDKIRLWARELPKVELYGELTEEEDEDA